jgi:hypothetical protein
MNSLDPLRISSNNDSQTELDERPSTLVLIAINFQRFLWWAAGKSPAFMELCGVNTRMKYAAVGLFMAVVIPILSCVAMGRYLALMQLNIVICFIGGVFWAMAIFALDRVILLFTAVGNGVSKWLKAGLRFLMAFIVSFLIAEGLITLFLEGEINAALANRVESRAAAAGAKARAENETRKTELIAENSQMHGRLDASESKRTEAERMMLAEADGTDGTYVPGEGKYYERRKQAFDRASADYNAQTDALSGKIIANEKEIQTFEDDAHTRKEAKEKAEQQANGLLARHEALMSIVFGSFSAFLIYICMTLTILLLETTPLVQKLLSDGDEYDRMIRAEEGHIHDENSLSDQMSRQSVILKRTLWERVYRFIREGRDLPDAEKRLGGQVYSALISSLLEQLFGSTGQADLGKVDILFNVADQPEIDMTLQLPTSAATSVTIGDLNDEIEKIGMKLPQNGHGPQQFLKAETSLGREIWINEPLVEQLESDKRVVLFFGNPPGAFVHSH